MDKLHSTLDNLPSDRDDFELINGIGKGVAKELYRSGIHRFSELALFTPEELAERVRTIVSIAPIKRIMNDDWIGQARELGKRKLKPVTPKQFPPGQRELANFLVIFMENTSVEGNTSIQTIVNHEQSSLSERWNEVATDVLIQWMLGKANLQYQNVRGTDSVTGNKQKFLVPEEELEEKIELSLTDLWVSQTTTLLQADDTNHQKLMRVEGKLMIKGPDAHSLTYERVPFNIEFYLVAVENNFSSLLATYTSQLEPDVLDYGFQQNLPIPQNGRYRLYLSYRLHPPFTAEAQTQGPLIRVSV